MTDYYSVEKDDSKVDLLRHNRQTDVVQIMNKIGERQYLTKDEFNAIQKQHIKKQTFNCMMNLFFLDKTEKWSYENEMYKNLANFEVDKSQENLLNYKILHLDQNGFRVGDNWRIKDSRLSIEAHLIEPDGWGGGRLMPAIIVYHQGRVCYHSISYQGEYTGMLFDFKSKRYLRWAKLKHCSPVQNIQTGRII